MQELNRPELERTLGALSELGRLEATDAALVALCRSTASAVDAYPARAGLVQQYRECLVCLSELGANDGGSDLDRLIEALRSPVGDGPASGPGESAR